MTTRSCGVSNVQRARVPRDAEAVGSAFGQASRYTSVVISAHHVWSSPGVHDDSEIDLPPSDGPLGEEGEPASDEADADDLDPVPTDAATDAFDDSTGEDDPVGDEELDPIDDGGLDDEAGLAREADLDEVAEFPEDREGTAVSLLAENDEVGVGNEDFGISEDHSSANLDGGEEGPRDADEELREEDLPSLDADDQGDGEEEAFYELDGEGAPPFPWEDERWACRNLERVPAAVAVVSIASGAIAVAGDPPKLWGIVDDGVESKEPTGAPREGWRSLRLSRKTGELFIDTDAGVFVSRDGGRSFAQGPAEEMSQARAQSLHDMEREISVRGFDLRGIAIGAAIVVDEAGTILAAVSRKAAEGGPTYLVRFPASASLGARTVGSVGGLVWDLSWDEPRRRLWVASDVGIALLTQRPFPQ